MKSRVFVILGVIIFLLTGCGVNDTPANKTEYLLGETGIVDQYTVVCDNFEKIDNYNNKNGFFLKVNYEIINNSKDDVEINLKEQFKLYDDESLINSISNENIKLSDGEKKNIEVIFEIDKTTYNATEFKIIFYSGIVSNNIAFILEK